MAGKSERIAWRVLGLGAAVAAGFVARKVATTAWQKGVGEPPPANPEDPSVTWAQAVGWAVAMGAAMGLARMLASRQLAAYWKKSTGHLPPGISEVT